MIERLVEPRPPAPMAVTAVPFGAGVSLATVRGALERRLPGALAYYRREGVAPAFWAGVAASVVVTTAVWLARSNARSRE